MNRDQQELVASFCDTQTLLRLHRYCSRRDARRCFLAACALGDAEALSSLIGRFQESLRCEVAEDTPLQWAAASGSTKVVRILKYDFALGPDDARAGDNAPLQEAAAHGHVEVMRVLGREFGLGPDDARAGRNLALRLAAKYDQVGALRVLRTEFGLGPDDARDVNNYALVSAAMRGHLSALTCLLDEFALGSDDARVALEVLAQPGEFGLAAATAGRSRVTSILERRCVRS